MWWLAYISLGLFVGFAAGLLGIGGGMIMVPMLAMMFAAQAHFPQNEVLHLALGSSIAITSFTTLASLKAHHSRGGVLWDVFSRIAPAALFGTLLGSMLASRISAKPLAVFFTVVISCIAAQMMLDAKPKPSRELPGAIGLLMAGVIFGTVSAILGLAGGALIVPFLAFCNIKMPNAVGTSAAIGFPIALGGTLGYIYNGWNYPALPEWCLGFVYLPALLWMIPPSMLMAPVGARLAHHLPVSTLKRAFAFLLIILACRMLWGIFV